ncbi:MAG: hypothetical protein J6Y02_13110 [Pseudobutyrivibrio sp.]|nr:hypothetical protein [Pseudobutyrivibrio sp.]
MELYDYQISAVEKLQNGNILCGGVGSGKSRTALAYYYISVCKGHIQINGIGEFTEMRNPLKLYIITTARKRDTHEWEEEMLPFMLKDYIVDSWNNIEKYKDVTDSFFIFDEQRVVGYGKWSKTFIKIARKNKWILLSATPGDTWNDYAPVMIANGYYTNITQFRNMHIIFSRYTNYPKIERYINTDRLAKIKNAILIDMDFERPTKSHMEYIYCDYDRELYDNIRKNRWNYEEEKPIEQVAELCRLLRKVVNSDESRLKQVLNIYEDYDKVIIFYNFNYELEMLKNFCESHEINYAEWNGHRHQPIPDFDKWIYLVQYTAGAEGWNCIQTNCIIFFSKSYSYKQTVQAAGRINRVNTPFKDLYYFYLTSNSTIDNAISRALKNKRDFNEKSFIKNWS